MTFVWREITHKFYGVPTPGCFAWHHDDMALCDHEHDEEEERFTCDDARDAMSRIRVASRTENVDSPGESSS